MAPKAVDARKRFTRNHRFRGHGPLLQKAWPIPTIGGASTFCVGGSHGPESGECPGNASTGTSPANQCAGAALSKRGT